MRQREIDDDGSDVALRAETLLRGDTTTAFVEIWHLMSLLIIKINSIDVIINN